MLNERKTEALFERATRRKIKNTLRGINNKNSSGSARVTKLVIAVFERVAAFVTVEDYPKGGDPVVKYRLWFISHGKRPVELYKENGHMIPLQSQECEYQTISRARINEFRLAVKSGKTVIWIDSEKGKPREFFPKISKR